MVVLSYLWRLLVYTKRQYYCMMIRHPIQFYTTTNIRQVSVVPTFRAEGSGHWHCLRYRRPSFAYNNVDLPTILLSLPRISLMGKSGSWIYEIIAVRMNAQSWLLL